VEGRRELLKTAYDDEADQHVSDAGGVLVSLKRFFGMR